MILKIEVLRPYDHSSKIDIILGFRGGSRTAATSKMEHFVIIVNGWKPLTIITKRSILDVAAILDPPLGLDIKVLFTSSKNKFNSSMTNKFTRHEKICLTHFMPLVSFDTP